VRQPAAAPISGRSCGRSDRTSQAKNIMTTDEVAMIVEATLVGSS